jgi:hypothetical protein
MRPTLFVLPLKFVSKHLQIPDLGRIVDYGEVSILPEPAASPAPPEKAKGLQRKAFAVPDTVLSDLWTKTGK